MWNFIRRQKQNRMKIYAHFVGGNHLVLKSNKQNCNIIIKTDYFMFLWG